MVRITDQPDALIPIPVPHVVGLPQEDALAVLAEAGFGVSLRMGPSFKSDVGVVTLQDPPSGTSFEFGSTVRLVVGGGPAEPIVVIPDPDGEGGGSDEAPIVGPFILPE